MAEFGFQWHLSDRCNQRCAHCYQDRFDEATEQPVETLMAMADRILGGLADCPISINVTGGEPLLYPGLAPLLEHLHRYPNLAEVNLITNGTLAPAELLGRLAPLPRFRWLKVSLESGVAAVNDAVRGRGHLGRLVAHLPLLRDRSGGREVVLMMTLGRHNAGTIPETVEFAHEVGAAGIIFERFVPLGQSQAVADWQLGPRDWRAAVETILVQAGIEADFEELLPFRAFWLWLDPTREEALDGALCNLGRGSMALMPDGTVFPCRRLPHPLGNVLTTPLLELLERLAQFEPELRVAQLGGPRCGRCGVEGCSGCRALACATSGALWADDPQCPWPLTRSST